MEKGVTYTERGKPRSNRFIKILQCRTERQGSENASYKVTLFRGTWAIKRNKPEVALPWPWLTNQGSSLSGLLSPPWYSFPGFSPRLSVCRTPAWGRGRHGEPHASAGLLTSLQEPFGLQPGLLGPLFLLVSWGADSRLLG